MKITLEAEVEVYCTESERCYFNDDMLLEAARRVEAALKSSVGYFGHGPIIAERIAPRAAAAIRARVVQLRTQVLDTSEKETSDGN